MAGKPKPVDNQENADLATRIMERMVRMWLKAHADMKLGKPNAKAKIKANPLKMTTPKKGKETA